jgi:hypothetical protein
MKGIVEWARCFKHDIQSPRWLILDAIDSAEGDMRLARDLLEKRLGTSERSPDFRLRLALKLQSLSSIEDGVHKGATDHGRRPVPFAVAPSLLFSQNTTEDES